MKNPQATKIRILFSATTFFLSVFICYAQIDVITGGSVGIGTSSPGLKFSVNSGMNIDQAAANTGTISNTLIFGPYNSGEGIGSKRNSGGNQNGLDFYTSSANRMCITNGGNIGIGTTAVPKGSIGGAKLGIDGTASSVSAGPHVQFTTASDNYPLMHMLNWSHNNVSINFDAYFDGTAFRSSYSSSSFAIYKLSDNLNFNYAAATQTTAITWNIGMTLKTSGRVGIGTTNPAQTLDINGTAACTASAWTSDSTKKSNIRDLSLDALSIINQLRPVTFEWKKVIDNGMKGTQMGFVAQELERVLPSMVITRNDSVRSAAADAVVMPTGVAKNDSLITDKSVKYMELFPLFVKGMQQQQHMIDSLMTMVANLELGKQRSDDGQGHKETTSSIELANNSQPILYQNEPNPFNGSTVIRYFIPETVIGSALVVFYDMYGKEVNKLEIRERGFGKIEANTENLATGIYSYSIMIDGKSIDTKKMLKTK